MRTEAFLAQVHRGGANAPLGLRSPGGIARAERWIERHQTAAEVIRAALSFAVLAAVGGLGLFIICTGGVHG